MTTATLVSQSDARGRKRVTYTLGNYGPYVEHVSDVNAFIASAGPSWDAAMAAIEIAENIARVLSTANPVITTVHCTNNQMLAAARLAYKAATKTEAVFIGGALADQNLTNNQLANLFNVSNPSVELTAIKAKLLSHQTKRNDILSESGT